MNITTPEECLEYVNRVGICTWRCKRNLPELPSLESETPWVGRECANHTWFWKDDLHIERRLYFGMLITPDVPLFVSLEVLPVLIAARGDIDARTLFEKGEIASNALKVYEHVERNGPTATGALPWPKGSRMLYMAALQQRFLLTKYDLTGRTRGTYGYRWCLAEDAFPDAFATAAKLAVPAARSRVIEHLNRSGADVLPERAAKLFRWQAI